MVSEPAQVSPLSLRTLVADIRRPATARVVAVTDEYHGTRVTDPYRWMEEDSQALAVFASQQDEYARAVLDRFPSRSQLRTALEKADRTVARVLVDGLGIGQTSVIFRRSAGDDAAMRLFVRALDTGIETELLAKGAIADSETLDFVSPSNDGRYVAIGISANGNEDSTIRVIDTESATLLPDRIDRAQYASVSWRKDNQSFYYWRRANPLSGHTKAQWFENSHSYLHQLGSDPEGASPLLGPSIRDLNIASSDFSFIEDSISSQWLLGVSTPGGTASLRVFAADARASSRKWRTVADYEAGVVKALAHQDHFYLLTRKGAPHYKITKVLASSGTTATAVDFVAEGPAILEDIVAAEDGLYVLSRIDEGSRIERVSWDGATRTIVPLPETGAIRGLRSRGDTRGVVFSLVSWLSPPRWYAYRPDSALIKLELAPTSSAPLGHLNVRHELARSADGTEIPVTIIARRDAARDGSAPAWLHGYAAYGLSTLARFDPKMLVWVELGGVLAFCHGRGGGERGDEWHLGGSRHNKERGVEDYIACGEHLVAQRWTSSPHLVAFGRSAGGVLVGGALTRRPDLFAAVLLAAPVLNLLRFENGEGGPANVPEFGTVKDESDFRALYASDPFHRVRTGVVYPSVMIAAGANDVRVPLWQPAKMVARLQMTSSANPTLFRVAQDAGHGLVTTRQQAIDELVDLMAFALASAQVTIR